MFRTRRIAWRGTDTLIVFTDQFFVAEVFVRRVAPVNFTNPLVEIFCERFGQTIRHGFNHDFVVVIMLRVKRFGERVFLQPAGYREGPQIIGFTAQFRRDEVCQAVVGEADFFRLLTQMMADGQHMRPGFITVDFDIVANAVGREQPYYAAWVKGFLRAELVEHLVGVFKQALRFFADYLVFENARVFARQRPGHKERRPVDVIAQGFNAGRDFLYAQAMGNGRRIAFPVESQVVFARGL